MVKKQSEHSKAELAESGQDGREVADSVAAETNADTTDRDDDEEGDHESDAGRADAGVHNEAADARPAVVDDAEPEPQERPRSRKAAKQKRDGSARSKRGRAAAAPTLSEKEIDSPSRQTLGMLSVVAAASLVMWGVGRAKCNYREVGEGRKPRNVTLEERTRTPKDVAFEFQHAYATYNVDIAAKLATGEAKTKVQQRKDECGAACDKKHEELATKVNSISELLKRTGSSALARAWSDGNGTAGKHLVVLRREGRDWKVASYEKDAGQDINLPGETRTQQPGEGHNAPAGSAQPSPGSSAQPSHPPAAGSARLPGRGVPRPATSVRRAAPGSVPDTSR